MVYQNTFRFPEKAAHEVETPKSSFISEAEVCQMGPKSEGCLPKKFCGSDNLCQGLVKIQRAKFGWAIILLCFNKFSQPCIAVPWEDYFWDFLLLTVDSNNYSIGMS